MKFVALLTAAMEFQFDVYYWMDSTSVLRFMANKMTRFHTFMVNHVTTIQEGSGIEQWRYALTAKKPNRHSFKGDTP